MRTGQMKSVANEIGEIKNQYNAAVAVCLEVKDDGSRELFEGLIRDEDRHVDYLEAQIHAIAEMGIGNYLSQQLYGRSPE